MSGVERVGGPAKGAGWGGPAVGPGHGGPAKGSWPPFESGNGAGMRHGTYARLRLAPRAEQIATAVREVVPVRSPADDATVDALAMTLAQLERANLVLAPVQARELSAVQAGESLPSEDRDDLRRLAQDARAWANTALRYLEVLGLTPLSRAKLGLDLVKTEDAVARLAEVGAEVRARAERRREEVTEP